MIPECDPGQKPGFLTRLESWVQTLYIAALAYGCSRRAVTLTDAELSAVCVVQENRRDMFLAIDRYIFRITFRAFLLVLFSLTGVIWLTQALREIDVITTEGQTLLVFLGITGLLIPVLALDIGPIAFLIAVCHTLDQLNNDSETVSMNAAGILPWRFFRPFLAVALVVMALTAFLAAYLAPRLERELQDQLTSIRTDLVTNIVQPGRFLTVGNLTFHIRERLLNNQLLGVMIDDRRNPASRVTLLAEQGFIEKTESRTFFVLEKGSAQVLDQGKPDPRILLFDRYPFDLSAMKDTTSHRTGFRPSERYLWELASPDPNDERFKSHPGQFRAEFHNRLVLAFEPLAFLVFAFAILGPPLSTRQGRGYRLIVTIVAVGGLKLVDYGCLAFSVSTPGILVLLYVWLGVAILLGFLAISRSVVIEPPRSWTAAASALSKRLARLEPT